MNTLVKALVLSLSTALVTAPVMAAPQDHRGYDNRNTPHAPAHPVHHQKVSHDQKQQYGNSKKQVNPSRDWKVGQKLPAQYTAQSYKVDKKQMKKLAKPNKNQEWIKVNGDYVLVNAKNHVILKIING